MSKIFQKTPQKSGSAVTAQRVLQSIQNRFNPLRGITPEILSGYLDQWDAGRLRPLAIAMEKIEERDDLIKGVAGKRKKALARRSWEILVKDDSEAAKAQKEALTYLYNGLVATHATELDLRGDVSTLIKQMADCVGKRYAVHELLWRPDGAGRITVEARFVPLWFFESTTGQLRFLQTEGALNGIELRVPGELLPGWMVTMGDGLMVASAICWMYKRLPLQDWLSFCGKFGLPGILGKTDATFGSEEWNQMVQLVGSWANDLAAVVSRNSDVDIKEPGKSGDMPFAPLVDRMDRCIAALWRGGDLSTMSAGSQAVGANSQSGESEILEADDAAMVTSQCNQNLDAPALRYLFGPEVEILAHFRLREAEEGTQGRQNFLREVWKGFQADGTVSDMMANLTDLKRLTEEAGLPANEEYVEPYLPVVADGGRVVTGGTTTDAEGDIVGGVAADPASQKAGLPGAEMVNSVAEDLGVPVTWLAPVRELLLEMERKAADKSLSDEEVLRFCSEAAARLPELFGKMDHAALAEVMEKAMGAGVLRGVKGKI